MYVFSHSHRSLDQHAGNQVDVRKSLTEMSRRISAGVIGYGRIGRQFVSAMQENEPSNSRLSSFTDNRHLARHCPNRGGTAFQPSMLAK